MHACVSTCICSSSFLFHFLFCKKLSTVYSSASSCSSSSLSSPSFFSSSSSSSSQFWIVVIKVDEQFRQMIRLMEPDTLYPNNTFLVSSTNTTTSNDPIPPGAPYIAAEIFELSSPLIFIVGGMQSSVLNSNDMFVNPPLESNTEYAMFVRAFSPPARSSTTVSIS